MLATRLKSRLQGKNQTDLLVDDEWLLLQIKDGSCSAGCKYCYAKHEAIHEYEKLGLYPYDKTTSTKIMTEGFPALPLLEMPLETVKELAQYICDAGIRKIAIIGSEPTEHSQFQDILNLLKAQNIDLAIYTNGRHLERLHSDAISRIILHLSCTPTKEYMNEVRGLLKCNKVIDLRVNYSDAHLSEQNQVNEFLTQLTPREKKSILVKYSITSSVPSENIEGFDIDGLKSIKNTLLNYLEKLHNMHPEVTLFCERSLFKCCFNDFELEKYSYANIVFKCSMEFIIYRDKKMKFCSPGRYFFDGYTINSASDILESLPKVREKMKELFSLPSFPACNECEHRVNLMCYGGCISYKNANALSAE